VIVKKAKIIFKNFPVYPWQFAILNLESEKKKKDHSEGALTSAPFVFGEELERARCAPRAGVPTSRETCEAWGIPVVG